MDERENKTGPEGPADGTPDDAVKSGRVDWFYCLDCRKSYAWDDRVEYAGTCYCPACAKKRGYI